VLIDEAGSRAEPAMCGALRRTVCSTRPGRAAMFERGQRLAEWESHNDPGHHPKKDGNPH